MRETFRKIVSGVMAVLLMQLSLPATSFGEEPASQVAQAVGADADDAMYGAEREAFAADAASSTDDGVVTAKASAHSVDSDVITVEAQVRGINSEGWRVFVSYAKPESASRRISLLRLRMALTEKGRTNISKDSFRKRGHMCTIPLLAPSTLLKIQMC